jgi:hypothetical protein
MKRISRTCPNCSEPMTLTKDVSWAPKPSFEGWKCGCGYAEIEPERKYVRSLVE